MEANRTNDLFMNAINASLTQLQMENEALAIALADVNGRLGRTAEVLDALHRRVVALEGKSDAPGK